MRTDWLPFSSAALVVGAACLFYGSQNLPRARGEGLVFQHVVDNPDDLLSPAVILLIGGTALVCGLPAVHSLFRPRARTGLVGLALTATGAVMLAGFAQQLVLVRSLAQQHPWDDATLSGVMAEQMQGGLLAGAYGAFFVGELCIAWALLRACGVPRWIPWALVAHVVLAAVTLPFGDGWWGRVPAYFMLAAFAGIGITTNVRAMGPGVSSRDIAERHARERNLA